MGSDTDAGVTGIRDGVGGGEDGEHDDWDVGGVVIELGEISLRD